jgi:general secretion pathway protein K
MKRPSFRREQRGLALVMVLWMVAALLVTATGVVYAVRGEVRAVSAFREVAAAGALGDAGIVLAARALMSEPKPEGRLRQFDFDLDQATVSVQVTPLAGLIDINAAEEPLLTELLIVAGQLDSGPAAGMAQRILDWRDPDDAARPSGAEDTAYAAAGSPFRTRGGPFEAPEDLLQVLGMEFELFERLRPLITVHARSNGRVDPAAAPGPVLRVIAGGSDAIASSYEQARESSGALADSTRFPAAFRSRSPSARYQFAASVALANGSHLVTRKVLDLASDQNELPWQTLWIERRVEAQGGG